MKHHGAISGWDGSLEKTSSKVDYAKHILIHHILDEQCCWSIQDKYLASSCCQMKAPSLWPTACSSSWPAAWCARSGTSWSWRRCGRPRASSQVEECRPHIMTVQLSEMDGPVELLQLSEILLLQWFLQNPKHIWGHGCSSGWHSRLPFWHISLAFGKASLVILEKVRLTWDNKILGSFPLGSEWSSLASPRELSHQDSIPFKLKLLELVGSSSFRTSSLTGWSCWSLDENVQDGGHH